MRKPIGFWAETFRHLGFTKRKQPNRERQSRGLRLEHLETRDLLATVTMSASSNVQEGGSSGYFTVARDDNSGNLTVYYDVGGSATNGSDYTTLTGSVVIPNGQVSTQITLIQTDDSVVEESETVELSLASGDYFLGSPSSGSITIIDNDVEVSMSSSSASIAEDSGSTAILWVHRIGDTSASITINYTVEGSATEGVDYSPLQRSVTINAGSTSSSIGISPINDSFYEPAESVAVTLVAGSGYTVAGGSASATATITNDDPMPYVKVEQSHSSADESAYPGNTFTFTREYGDNTDPLTLHLAIGGTATHGQDYYFRNSPSLTELTIPAGASSASLTLIPVDNYLDDGNRTVAVNLQYSDYYGFGGSSQASFTIVDNESFGASHDISNTKSGPCCYSLPVGSAQVDMATGFLSAAAGLTALEGKLAYNQAWDARPIIAQDVTFTSPATTATSIEVQLTFGGLAQSSVYYDPASITLNVPMRIAIEVNASALASGRYGWSMAVIEHYSASGDVTQNFTGVQDIRTSYSAAYGALWAPVFVDRLIVSGSGALWEEGRGNSYWFDKVGDDYVRTAGEAGFSTLTYHSGTGKYTLRNRYGDSLVFDSTGRLTKRISSTENETAYAYTDGDGDSTSDEISTITDSSGRVTTFTYTSNRLSAITDFDSRVTSVTITSNKLLSVASPDPDGGGPLSAPVISFGYDGGTGLLTSITNAESETTTFTYYADRTVAEIEYPDETTEGFDVPLRAALVIPGASWGSSGNPADLVESSDVVGAFVDRAGESSTYRINELGQITELADALTNTTWYIRNHEGLIVAMFEPDPDGAGALGALATYFHYDATGNLLLQHNPDGTERSFEYESTWNRVTSFTDELGHVTQWAVTGFVSDVFSVRRVVGLVDSGGNGQTNDVVTSFTYTAHVLVPGFPPAGLVATVTDALGFITTYEYDTHGLVTKITYADGTALEAFVEFDYDSADNLILYTDEVGRVTAYGYDALDRLITVTLPDPDGGGDLESPVYHYAYDGVGRLIRVTDALDRVIEYVYNAKGQLEQIILPDHDENQADSITTFYYDAFGRLEETLDANGGLHTLVYDELSRVIERHGPEPEEAEDRPVYKATYGALGWVLSTTDPLNSVTNYSYENFGRKVTTKQPHATTGVQNTGPQSSVEYDAVGNLVKATDGLGRVTTYTYDELGRLATVTQPDPDGVGGQSAPVWTYGYDKLGQVTSVTDPLGNVTSYTYNARGWVTKITSPDPDGEGGQAAPEVEYDYDDAGQVILLIDALDYETSYEYDALGRLVKVTRPDPDGEGEQEAPETHYEYDAVGNLTAVVDALGNRTEYEYDAHDNLITVTQEDPDGEGPVGVPVWHFTYDDLGNLLTSSDPLGRVTTNAYDGLNRLVSVTLPDPDGVGALASPVWAYHYDLAGNLTSVVDPLTHTTSYAYDHLHRLTTVTRPDPDGEGELTSPVTTYAYNAASELTGVTDPLNRTTSYVYDGLGRLKSVTRPDPDGGGVLASPVTSYAYDLVGNGTGVTDPLGRVTTFAYDNLYRLITVTQPDPDGGGGLSAPVTSYGYDARGQQTSRTDALSHVTTFDYDGLGRLIKVTQPDPDGGGGGIAPWTTYVYDAMGNLTVLTDTLNHDYQYEYDQLYRQTRIIDPNGTSTWLGYDEVGNLISLQDPEDNQTTWAYDNLDRITSETNELGDARHFKYDAANNLIEKTDRNERVTQYVYDNLDRLKEEKWKSGGSTLRTLTYTFDAASQLTAASDPSAEYDFVYDGLGRATSVVADLNGLTPDVTLTQTFDAASRRTSLKATIGATLDFQNIYVYDNLDRLTTVAQVGQGGNAVATKVVNLAYNALGQFTSIQRVGSNLVATSTYTYDNTNRLTDLDHARSGTPLAGYDIAWDAANRIAGIANTQHSGESATFTYDDFGQLTGADRASTPNDEAYAYDDNGNRETANGATYTIDTNNRITSDGTFTYDYDDEGNRILKTEISSGDYVEYEWDYRNRLTAVSFYDDSDVLQKRVEYDYDVFDRRVAKRVDSDGDTDFDSGQFFVYDGAHIALVFDGAGTLTNRYLHGPAIDQILADEQVHWDTSDYITDELYWPLVDHLGTVRDIATHNSGTHVTSIANHLAFDSFGNIESESNDTIDHLFAFTGRERDDDSQLMYYRRRWYDGRIGQFLSEDSLGFAAGDPNLRRYVDNQATRLIDPSGLLAINTLAAGGCRLEGKQTVYIKKLDEGPYKGSTVTIKLRPVIQFVVKVVNTSGMYTGTNGAVTINNPDSTQTYKPQVIVGVEALVSFSNANPPAPGPAGKTPVVPYWVQYATGTEWIYDKTTKETTTKVVKQWSFDGAATQGTAINAYTQQKITPEGATFDDTPSTPFTAASVKPVQNADGSLTYPCPDIKVEKREIQELFKTKDKDVHKEFNTYLVDQPSLKPIGKIYWITSVSFTDQLVLVTQMDATWAYAADKNTATKQDTIWLPLN